MSFDIKLINGDFSFLNGDIKKVEGTSKLVQDISKICLTDAGANPLQRWYGSYLSRALIGSGLDISIINNMGKIQLTKALENLQNLQAAQLRSGQSMSLDEQLAAIAGISVDQDPNDISTIRAQINCLSKSLKPVNTIIEL